MFRGLYDVLLNISVLHDDEQSNQGYLGGTMFYRNGAWQRMLWMALAVVLVSALEASIPAEAVSAPHSGKKIPAIKLRAEHLEKRRQSQPPRKRAKR